MCQIVRSSAVDCRLSAVSCPRPRPGPATPFALRSANGKCHFNYVHSTKILCGQSSGQWLLPSQSFVLVDFVFAFALSISICALSAFAQSTNRAGRWGQRQEGAGTAGGRTCKDTAGGCGHNQTSIRRYKGTFPPHPFCSV